MRENMIDDLKEKILDADMVLVGIGEEFEVKKADIEKNGNYRSVLDICRSNEQLLPYIKKDFIENSEDEAVLQRKRAYRQLFELIKDKNYFLVSLCMDGIIHETEFDEQRIVEPCGTLKRMQCSNKCSDDLYPDDLFLADKIRNVIKHKCGMNDIKLPICPKCGKQLVFNNIFAENYAEEGYLPKWQLYTKWLQGTVNRKVCILEMGVGMRFPTVIRWPFEKVVYFNNKASFFRIHSSLYQIAEEISDRSTGFAAAPLDFLIDL